MNLTPQERLYLTKIAQDPKSWAELFITLPRTGEKFVANYVQRLIFKSKKRKRLVLIHRRGGKTAGGIIYILWKCFTTPNTEVLIIAPGESQLIKIFNDMDDILYANPLLNADVTGRRAKPMHSREFVNGSKIRAFIAKDGSKSLRGQSGDLIYVDEADFIDSDEWKVIDPIVRGDLNRKPPELIATSTPNVNPKSRFMNMVNAGLDKDVSSEFYDESMDTVFVPLDKNPDYTLEMVEEIRQDYLPDRVAQYQQEYLCQPVSASDLMVFKPHQVQEASALEPWVKDHRYGYSRLITEIPPKVSGEIRTMGVDWDRVQAGPSLLMVSYFPGIDHYKVLYREEVDKNIPHLFNYTCDRIIDLHKIARLDWLYLEATSDVMQVETLQILARQRAPDLYNKIIAINFNSNHESFDMVTKDKITRNIKTVIIGQLQNLFENGRVKFPKADGVLLEQLSTYKIMGYTSRGPRYSKINEHFIDALGLACWAMFIKYDNPLGKHMNQGGIMTLNRPYDSGTVGLKKPDRSFSLGGGFGGSIGRTMPSRDTF